MPSYHDIQQFLYREARLMDEHRYDDWLALWMPDAHYWIPSSDDDRGIDQAIALVNEEFAGIEDRVKRLNSGAHYAQDPKSQLSRVISNVEIIEDNGERTVVSATFNLTASRKGQIDIIAGRSTYTLRWMEGRYRIVVKKVVLANRAEAMKNLTYLV